jgi:uncharacterized integral membrane protein
MRILVAVSLIIAILAVVFAFQNSVPVELYLGPFKLPETPLALVILLAMALGVLIGYLAWLPQRLRSGKELKAYRRSLHASVGSDAAKDTPVRAEQVASAGSPADELEKLARSTEPKKQPESGSET